LSTTAVKSGTVNVGTAAVCALAGGAKAVSAIKTLADAQATHLLILLFPA
jgi:hypothetical protein